MNDNMLLSPEKCPKCGAIYYGLPECERCGWIDPSFKAWEEENKKWWKKHREKIQSSVTKVNEK